MGLADHHPELFERAVAIERKILKDAGVDGDASFEENAMKGGNYTWSPGETLPQLIGRRDKIMERHEESLRSARKKRRNLPLVNVLSEALDEEDEGSMCTMCHV